MTIDELKKFNQISNEIILELNKFNENELIR
jgi:hypothetical protein